MIEDTTNNKLKNELASSMPPFLFVNLFLDAIFILMLIFIIFTGKHIFQTMAIIVLLVISLHFISYLIYFFLIKKYEISDIFDWLCSRTKAPPNIEKLKKQTFRSLVCVILLVIASLVINYFVTFTSWIYLVISDILAILVSIKVYLRYRRQI